MARRIDWSDELDAIALAAARAPRRRRRGRSLLRPAILAAIERQADEEYERWFRDMDEAVGRLIKEIDRPARRRRG